MNPTRRTALAGATLVLGLFAVFNANFRDIPFGDTLPATFLPASIVRERNLSLDEFGPLFAAHPSRLFLAQWLGAVQERDGEWRSSYPVGGSLLAAPVYALPIALGRLQRWQDYAATAKLAASLMVALSAGLLFLAARELCATGPALLLAAAYGLATDAWTVASQAAWQHGPGMLCLSAALLALLRLARGGGHAAAAAAGLFTGLAVLCRDLNAVPALFLSVYVALHHRHRLVAFAVPLALLGAWLLTYNLSTFGRPFGGYEAILSGPALRRHGVEAGGIFSGAFWPGLAGVLASPGKGLLVFTPHLGFALAAAALVWRDPRFVLGRYLALWAAVWLVLVAKIAVFWWGGASYGPRYLCELLPPLTLLAAFGVCVAWGAGVQAVGAFFSPCGWYEKPVHVEQDPDRLWNAGDSEIARCLRRGLAEGPRPASFLGAELYRP